MEKGGRMIINIKKLILEAGVVDTIQLQLQQKLNNQSKIGKEIDAVTAQEIKKIREKEEANSIQPQKKKTLISESIYLTKQKLVNSGIQPTNTKPNVGNGLKGVLNAEQGSKDVMNALGKAGQGLAPGNRSKVKQIQENTIPSTMGKVKPLPKRPSGALVDARNEKSAILKDSVKIPSAYTILKNNPTHNAKFGQKILRDEARQTNANGEGVN